MGIEFKKYSSIDNITRMRTVNYIIQNGYATGEWVSTLKIHGANYGLYTDGIVVKSAKRSGWIEGDSFYGDYNFDYTDNVLSAIKNYRRLIDSSISTMSFHGEIFGGLYNHPNVKRDKSAVRVQKEVQYTPHNDFIVFDIKVDGKLLDWDAVKEICDYEGFLCVPELARGKFDDLINNPVVFPDPLYKMFGLPEIEDNYAEGWVLKPVTPLFFGNGERIILKGKNPKLSGKSKQTGKPVKPEIELSEDGKRLNDEIQRYITDNRLRNVISHGEIENITNKDFGRLLGLFTKDIFSDFMKDNGNEFDKLEKKEKVKLKKNMNKMAGDVLRENFVNILDNEF